jgi:mRNA interferase MazF
MTGFAVVCPITSRVRPFPTGVVLPHGLPVAGEILLSHIRSVDVLARPIISAGARLDRATRAEVRAKLGAFVTI